MSKPKKQAITQEAADPQQVFAEFLSRYVKRSDVTLELGLTRQQISHILTGTQGRRASKETAERIERITGGEIRSDWIRNGRPAPADRCPTCGHRVAP